MKRTYDTSVGGTIFHVEEDAYARLAAYLEAVRSHFQPYQDSADIVDDIENRIAEQCVQRKPTSRLITLADVEHIISVMGRIDQFEDALPSGQEQREGAATPASGVIGSGQRTLYRDPDNRVIAGVAAGIARYWNVDLRWVQLAFLTLTILGMVTESFIAGITIPIYLLCWLFIPLAKTTTDKLRMRGDPVTLVSVEQQVREGAITATSTTRTPLTVAMFMIGSAIRTIVVGAVWVAGIGVAAWSAVTVVGLTAFLVMVLSNPKLLLKTAQLSSSSQLGLAYYPFVVCGYLIAAIPLVLLGTVVLTELQKRRGQRWNGPTLGVYMAALSVWMVALLVGVWLLASHAPGLR